jgi:hypothetical protein
MRSKKRCEKKEALPTEQTMTVLELDNFAIWEAIQCPYTLQKHAKIHAPRRRSLMGMFAQMFAADGRIEIKADK